MPRKSIILLALTSLLFSLGTAPAGASHTRTCEDDELSGGTYERVLVPEGESCTITGATVHGSVLVRAGGSLLVDGSDIGNDIRAKSPAYIGIADSTIGDDVKISGTTGNPAGERNYIRDCTTIGGNLRIRFTGSTSEGWKIGGGTQADCPDSEPDSEDEGVPLANGGVLVAKDAKISDNDSDDDGATEIEITGNTFLEDLDVDRNVVPVSITDNTIGDDLDCDDNNPEPTGSNNTVGDDALDQCASLVAPALP
ncbi:MAG: hypothetical protein ACRDIU_04285 [Actinomycetota bacterium]